MSESLKGRWTITVCPKCGTHDGSGYCMEGPCADAPRCVDVPAVPCNPAAVERAAEAAARFDGSLWNDPTDEDAAWYRELAEAVLRAAGSEDT